MTTGGNGSAHALDVTEGPAYMRGASHIKKFLLWVVTTRQNALSCRTAEEMCSIAATECLPRTAGISTPAPPHKRASESGASAPRHIAVRVRSPSDPLGAAGGNADDADGLSTVREDSVTSETPARREQTPLIDLDQQPGGSGGSGQLDDGGGSGSGQFFYGSGGSGTKNIGQTGGKAGGATAAGRRTAASTIDVGNSFALSYCSTI